MEDRPPPAKRKIVELPLRPADVERRVHTLSKDSANVIWTFHGEEQGDWRDITTDDALKALRIGTIRPKSVERITRDEIKCVMSCRLAGRRDIAVVTVVWSSQKLIVVTVMWEDSR